MPETPADRPFHRRVLLNTASTGIANGWAIVVALVSIPLVLKGLGTTAFGLWALLQTFSAINGWFSLLDLGLGTATTREVAARRAVDDGPGVGRTVGSSLAVMAGLAVASAALIAVVGPVVLPGLFRAPGDLEPALRAAIALFGLQVAGDLVSGSCQASLEGLQRIDLSRGIDMARRTLVAGATAITALVTEELLPVVVASLLATLAGTLVALATLLPRLRGTPLRAERATARDLLAAARTLALLRPLGVLHRTVDRLVVGAVLGPSAVSVVEIATQLQNGTDAVLSASSYAVVPSAAHLRARGDERTLAQLLETGTRYVLLATLPVAALSAVLGAPAIRLWVGPRYDDAAGLLVLGVVGLGILAGAQVASSLMLGVGRAAAILRVALVAIVVNVAGSVVLVNVVGTAGAFQATILAATVTTPLLLRAALREVDLPVGRLLRTAVLPALAPAAAAAAGAGAIVALPLADLPTLLLGGLLGVAAAVAAALAVGLQRGEARALARSVGRRRGEAGAPG